MTAPQTSRTLLDPVAAAWLAGGLARAVDTVLISRLERRRIRVADGEVHDDGLDRADPIDATLLDALGARGRRDVQTVYSRVSRDRRLAQVHADLLADGLLARRGPWGLADRPDRPARTAAGRRLLAELRAAPQPGGAWEVALQGRGGLTDLAHREALQPRRAPALPPQPRRHSARRRGLTAEGYAGGAAVVSYSSWGDGGFGGFGDCGAGGGDGGGC